MTTDFAERLRLLAMHHAHHAMIRIMPYAIELVRRDEPVIIGVLYWSEIHKVDLIAWANEQILKNGLQSSTFMQGSDYYCLDCRTKLVGQFERCPTCHPPVQTCHVCGCTDDDCSRCVAVSGAPCSWVHKPGEKPLCSVCRDQGLPVTPMEPFVAIDLDGDDPVTITLKADTSSFVEGLNTAVTLVDGQRADEGDGCVYKSDTCKICKDGDLPKPVRVP